MFAKLSLYPQDCIIQNSIASWEVTSSLCALLFVSGCLFVESSCTCSPFLPNFVIFVLFCHILPCFSSDRYIRTAQGELWGDFVDISTKSHNNKVHTAIFFFFLIYFSSQMIYSHSNITLHYIITTDITSYVSFIIIMSRFWMSLSQISAALLILFVFVPNKMPDGVISIYMLMFYFNMNCANSSYLIIHDGDSVLSHTRLYVLNFILPISAICQILPFF